MLSKILYRIYARFKELKIYFVHNSIENLFIKSKQMLSELSKLKEPSCPSFIPRNKYANVNNIEELIASSIEIYYSEISYISHWARFRNEKQVFPEMGMYDWIEAQVLYLLIRLQKPEVVVEISPNYGYSTGFILLAMNKNDKGILYSFDLSRKYSELAIKNFSNVGIDFSRQKFYEGDVKTRVVEIMDKPIDLLFMDSDHSYEFAEWYIETLYPLVRNGGLIHAHDVLRFGVRPHLGDKGEGKAIDEFIRENNISDNDYLYLSEFVRSQPIKPQLFQRLKRYPFGDTIIGSNNIEQNASFWMVKTF